MSKMRRLANVLLFLSAILFCPVHLIAYAGFALGIIGTRGLRWMYFILGYKQGARILVIPENTLMTTKDGANLKTMVDVKLLVRSS